jgi:hypothetical protein
MSVTRFLTRRGSGQDNQCWKLTPVYSACQEAYTIYCTLALELQPIGTTIVFPDSYRDLLEIRMVSSLILLWFLSTSRPRYPRGINK